MKRLLKICFDLTLLSFIPILSWFLLSIIVDKNLINVFTLIYPIQFVWLMFKSIFSVSPNIGHKEDKDKNAVMNGIVIGTIVGFIFFGLVILNINSYINFMNMDINIYKNFAIYSLIQLFIQLVFQFIIEKLYYENKNSLANKYSITFALINFIVLIISALLFKNQLTIIFVTLLSILLYTVYIFIKNTKKFKFNLNILKYIKYDSTELFNNLSFFIIFLFGLSAVMNFDPKYILSLTFIALITDTQWDIFESISEVAKIDIASGHFNYKKHRKNAYMLLTLLLSFITLLFIGLYDFYNLDIFITLVFLSFELINFIIYPIYKLKTCFLQLEYSPLITTSNKILSNILRFSFSFWPTPFCTGIGQVASSLYQLLTLNFLFSEKYIINKKGYIEKKEVEELCFT